MSSMKHELCRSEFWLADGFASGGRLPETGQKMGKTRFSTGFAGPAVCSFSSFAGQSRAAL